MTSTYLSTHFTLEEATRSDTALRLGIDNSHPTQQVIETARGTAARMERVRVALGAPIEVTSWIRCLQLNRALKSKDTSQHIKGEAVDFRAPAYGSPLRVCRTLVVLRGTIDFDQLILEHTWIHISWSSLPNAKQCGQVLSLLATGGYAVGLTDPSGRPL